MTLIFTVKYVLKGADDSDTEYSNLDHYAELSWGMHDKASKEVL